MASYCGVRRASGPQDYAEVHSFHTKGQARCGGVGAVRVLTVGCGVGWLCEPEDGEAVQAFQYGGKEEADGVAGDKVHADG